jgi:hypothetical protein
MSTCQHAQLVYVVIKGAAYPVIGQLNSRDHQNSPISGLPVVITNQTAFAGTALAIHDLSHPESYVRRTVERRGVHDGYAVPAGLYLNREVALEQGGGRFVVEYSLERGVFKRCTIDISGYPVVVEYGGSLAP